jgi:membrane-associated phospholipid phosphatase
MFLLALGSLIVSIICMGINMFYKVSVHCAGVTGPIFALIFVYGITAIALVPIVGLVGWSRIKLKNHTFAQTLGGTLLSLIIGLIIYTTLYY